MPYEVTLQEAEPQRAAVLRYQAEIEEIGSLFSIGVGRLFDYLGRHRAACVGPVGRPAPRLSHGAPETVGEPQGQF
jgi:hypothetical protein